MRGLTLTQQLQTIVRKYQEAGEPWPATTKEIAAWGIVSGFWKPHPDSLIGQLAEQISRAMREEYITDAQGRTVRAKHAARYDQSVLWEDIRTAPRSHMEIAFQQRRQQIVGDCRQLKTDVDSFNDNGEPGPTIQMVFDFSEDLAELEAMDVMKRQPRAFV